MLIADDTVVPVTVRPSEMIVADSNYNYFTFGD